MVSSQIAKVAAETMRAMEQIDEETNATPSNDDTEVESCSDSDDAHSDDDDDSGDEEIMLTQEDSEINIDGLEPLTRKVENEIPIDGEMLPVISAVPAALAPTLVDILLPPSKPAPTSSVLSPFTWPCLAGATCRRILHHYKRKRNEVDDEIRQGKQLPPLTRAERKKREKALSQRLFPSCAQSDLSSNEE